MFDSIGRKVAPLLCTWWLSVARQDPTEKAQATSHIRSLLRRFPYWWQGHHALAKQALVEGDILLAFRCAQAVSKLESTRFEGPLLLSSCYLARQQFEEAERHARLALSRLPGCIEAIENLSAALLPQERYSEVAEILLTVTDIGRYQNLSSVKMFLENRPLAP